jgi:hypothetical protein
MSQHLLKTLLALVLALFSLNVMAFNWGVVLGGLFLKKKMPSVVPFVGGVTGVYALKLAPWDSVHAYWWVPLLLDFGCVPCVVLLVLEQLTDKIKGDHGQD